MDAKVISRGAWGVLIQLPDEAGTLKVVRPGGFEPQPTEDSKMSYTPDVIEAIQAIGSVDNDGLIQAIAESGDEHATLRMRIAMAAMTGMMANPTVSSPERARMSTTWADIADDAFLMADAMIRRCTRP